MKRLLLALGIALVLSGCGRSMAEVESADNVTCTQLVTERNDKRPDAYAVCRRGVQEYRANSRCTSVLGC